VNTKLKPILNEGKLEKAAESYLSKMVKASPFKGKVYIAGGYVRDTVRGLDPKDIDLVVALPDGGIKFAEWITKKVGVYKRGSNPVTFPKFGTAKFQLYDVIHNGVDISDLDIEAVMTRSEEYTPGSRKPKVTAGTLAQDVERRDFTVNSLLKDLSTGEIIDLTGQGRADIKKGVVRTPLDPDVIFFEDPLRMLRAIRFTVKYGWDLPMFMIRSIKKNSNKIKSISNERIRDEIDKMLISKNPKQAIRLLKITGLLQHVMPELQALSKLKQGKYHTKDVLGHTMDVLEKVPPVLSKRLGALFHDVGKKATQEIVDDDVHFYAHEKVGADLTKAILTRLKYPTDMINKIVNSVENHMRLKRSGDEGEVVTDKTLRKLKRTMGDHLEDLLDIMDADNKSHGKNSTIDNQIGGIRKRLGSLEEPAVASGGKLPVSGKDLIQIFKLKPGPQFKVIMDKVQDAVDENPNLSKQQALAIVKKEIS
jgi:poly(A) polymerase